MSAGYTTSECRIRESRRPVGWKIETSIIPIDNYTFLYCPIVFDAGALTWYDFFFFVTHNFYHWILIVQVNISNPFRDKVKSDYLNYRLV